MIDMSRIIYKYASTEAKIQRVRTFWQLCKLSWKHFLKFPQIYSYKYIFSPGYTNITKQGCFITLYFLEIILLGTTKEHSSPFPKFFGLARKLNWFWGASLNVVSNKIIFKVLWEVDYPPKPLYYNTASNIFNALSNISNPSLCFRRGF